MSVKLSGTLPKSDVRNGVDVLHRELVNSPESRHVIVLVVDTANVKVDYTKEGPTYTPTAGVIHAEPILDAEARDAVLQHVAVERAGRLGESELDLDFGVSDPVDNIFRDAAKRFADNGVTVTFGDENNDDNN